MSLSHTTIAELAAQLKIGRGTIHKHVCGARLSPILEGLPSPINRRGKTLWINKDIEDWFESRRTFRPATVPEEPEEPRLQPRRGRPRKTAIPRSDGKGGAK